MTARMDQLRAKLREAGLDGIFTSKPGNIRYLCGATGTACELLVTLDDAVLLSNWVDITENAETAQDVVHGRRSNPAADAAAAAKARKLKRVALEAHVLPQAQYAAYAAAMPEVELVPTSGLIERLRWVKDEDEIALIEKGMRINEEACRYVVEHAREGISEFELAAGAEHAMRSAGADGLAFLIVQFGENAAKPHHRHSPRTLRKGDFILLDIGAVCSGYGSDTTRTFIFSEASKRQQQVYATVLEAQLATLAALKAGMTGAQAHEPSAAIIAEAGYANYYGHGVGHGINEGPSLRPGSADVLAPGNVVTVEPGIYVPNWGGVRIEDTVVITDSGYRNLATFPKELQVIGA